jgi:hypothetical protein
MYVCVCVRVCAYVCVCDIFNLPQRTVFFLNSQSKFATKSSRKWIVRIVYDVKKELSMKGRHEIVKEICFRATIR